MTNLPDDVLGENEVLSNRDKSRHGDERGLDSKTVQVEQFQDTVASHETPAEGIVETTGNTSALSGPMSDASSEKGSVKRPT